MQDVGILRIGAYVPLSRLDRHSISTSLAWANPGLRGLAKGEKSMGNWDEDAITFAVEAGRDLASKTMPHCGAMVFASTTMPFLDRANGAIVAEALRLETDIATREMTGSLRAATSAVRAELDSHFTGGPTLLLASDKRPTKPGSPQEMTYGDGAAALLLGREGSEQEPLIAKYLGGASCNADLVDHYRTAQSGTDYTLEERWLRDEGYLKIIPDVVGKLLEETDIKAADIDHVILPMKPRVGARVAKSCGLAQDSLVDTLGAEVGDTGVAHPLLMLAMILESAKAGEKILVIGFGQGADALLFEGTDHIKSLSPRLGVLGHIKRKRTETSYTKFLSFNGHLDLDWGLRAERDNRTAQSTAYRKRSAVTGMIGGTCRQCDTPQFPKFRVCVECGGIDTLEDHCFADSKASIKTFTEDWQAFTPSPPLSYGNISFEEGGNVFMELTDCEVGELEIGSPLRMVFRIKDIDTKRGFRRYFWKPTPLRNGD